MEQRLKTRALIFLSVAIAASVLLASSLSGLSLGPGGPFPGAPAGTSTTAGPSTAQPGPPASWSVFSGLLAAILIALGIYLVVRLITFTNFKRLIWIILALALLLLVLVSLPRIEPGSAVVLPTESPSQMQNPPEVSVTPLEAPPLQFVWIALMLAVLGAAGLMIVALRRSPAPAKALRREAERAVHDLEAGLDSTDVVIGCYLQMTRVLQRERGIRRERSLTVREFELTLDSLGLPRPPLLRLRELFEAVRYGNRKLEPEEERLAGESLKQIVAFFQPAGGP